MSPFNSNTSPSTINKMEADGQKHSSRRRSKMSFSYIFGDPFQLAMISISILAWLIAFVASIISAIGDPYPNFIWWSCVYFFCCILGITFAVAGNAVHTYKTAIVGYLAAGLILATSSINSLIYSSRGAEEAVAAGFILLAIVSIIWMFYFGAEPDAAFRRFVDSFALHKTTQMRQSMRSSRPISQHYLSGREGQGYSQTGGAQPYNATHLDGFETSSPNAVYPSGVHGDQTSAANYRRSDAIGHNQPNLHPTTTLLAGGNGDHARGPAQAEYPHQARAIYSYEANPDDANEISFSKHEILEISDVSGRWWQARKANGETGIAPSNYLILL